MSDINFSEKKIADDFDGALSVTSADIDGDGDLDILGAAWADDKITWWKNNGDGFSWTQNDLPGTFNGATSVNSADLDGDGDLDILGAAYVDDKITWWENNGDGSSWTQRDRTSNFDGARSVDSADVDGDGDLDILGAASVGDKIYWWENNNGDGSGWTGQNIASGFDGAFDVNSADIDGDGDIDILGAASVDDKISWWSNNSGYGNNWTQNDLPGTFDSARSVNSADVDGDGDLDILGAAFVDDKITWWENNGDGSSWTQNDISTNVDGAESVNSADVDGDGDLDIIGAASVDDKITWWENENGDGSSWNQHDLTDSFDGAKSVNSADVDGDGDLDIIGAAYDNDKITWWSNGRYIKEGNSHTYDLSDALDTPVQFSIAGGTAEEGVDYWIEDGSGNLLAADSSGSYSFTPTSGNSDLVVQAIDDNTYDPQEKSLTLTFSNYTFADGSQSSTHTIVDTAPSINISDYTTTIYETSVDFGDAVSLDGTDDYVEIAHDSSLSLNNLTLEAWIYPTE
ncbi:MAG: VCBS repeat-containing protein [Bacteroidota bacterium]